jgi:O-acetyl-ADP-ribose deacetylase (regulator of RNase III)
LGCICITIWLHGPARLACSTSRPRLPPSVRSPERYGEHWGSQDRTRTAAAGATDDLQCGMASELRLHLRDLNRGMTSAWESAFSGVADVTITCGDIFSMKPGRIDPGDPIDIEADAIVSPANSFGYMNGGIDAVYTHVLGPQVQERLQALLKSEHAGELPVGQAVIVATDNKTIPWCVCAPTMRQPMGVADTLNAFLAFRATLLAVRDHNRSKQAPIRTLLCPGLGTAVGNMPPMRCARQMRAAWDRALGLSPFFPTSLHAAAEDQERLLE